jgi:hypothetical protein
MNESERYHSAIKSVSIRWRNAENLVRDADAKREAATTYVWGWQDASGSGKDSDDAYRFGLAYGTVAALYLAELIWMRPNIADAFKSWREYGAIVEFHYAIDCPTALDHIEAPEHAIAVL